ncbi:MAG: HEPN domain-containing protein [Sulfuritalea sp.]|nr:HEPN domain-containing protein [Sulfuritalea sp.]
MSYRCSRARRTFETQLRQALLEITPLYKIATKNGGGAGARLLAAYYVFAFAQLEVYIKSFVEDSITAVSVSGASFDQWPDLMLAYLLHKSENLGAEYRRFGINDDEGAILDKLAQTARKIAAWGAGGAIPTAVDASAFLEKKKYPSPKNLPQLFRRLGVKQIWAVVSAAGRMNSEMILTSLSDLRTDIAHEGNVPPGFGLSDYRDRLAQMRRFVAALDRGVSNRFCKNVMPRATWNSAVA